MRKDIYCLVSEMTQEQIDTLCDSGLDVACTTDEEKFGWDEEGELDFWWGSVQGKQVTVQEMFDNLGIENPTPTKDDDSSISLLDICDLVYCIKSAKLDTEKEKYLVDTVLSWVNRIDIK